MTGIPERKKKTKMALLSVLLDAQLKSRAERRLNRMGMSGAEAVDQLYRFIAEYGRMPMTERFVTEDAQPPVTVTRRKGGCGKSADREDCAGFVQRFLTFLSDRGVRCSNPEEFRGKVLNCAEYEGVHRTVLMIMQHRAGLIANFFYPDETGKGLPSFVATLPDELVAVFGFTAFQAHRIVHQIRPAGLDRSKVYSTDDCL